LFDSQPKGFLPYTNNIPIKWSAPEVLSKGLATTKSDVYSFGILLWEIFEYGKKPFGWLSNKEAYDAILSGLRPQKPANCPASLYDLMIECWKENPLTRPSFPDLLEHIKEIRRETKSSTEPSQEIYEMEQNEDRITTINAYDQIQKTNPSGNLKLDYGSGDYDTLQKTQKNVNVQGSPGVDKRSSIRTSGNHDSKSKYDSSATKRSSGAFLSGHRDSGNP